MLSGKLLESSAEDDRTILATHTPRPQAPQSSVSEKSDAPSSGKASLVAQQKLGDFFPGPTPSAAPKTKYSDASLQQIANLLRLSDRERWSAVPRIYTVLRNIGQLQLIDEFIDEGFTDIWFPFTAQNLPPRLSPSIKAQFINTQSVVFTQALDLEKREGRHATFAADEPLWFESKGRLGRGAFGVVDKVISLITLQEYARKRMRRGNNFTKSKREIKDFKAELAILKTVNHHHCVKLVGSYTDPVYLGLIMDPVADCDLGTFLTEALTNTDKKSLLRSYFGCLASALGYLHERQIRHRDIKPPNILVKGDTVYLADFGIALDWSEMTRGTTTADTAKSPIYCAPEVARSEPRGPSADIWSLGCVFAEMVSVLKGSSIEDMRTYFKKASGSYMFHHNIETCSQWLMDLKRATATDNPPIEWSLKMLVFDRNERYTADQLLEVIQVESEPDHSKFVNQSFCGDCCMDQEHISSDGNNTGEDPWADSEDEDTLRAHDVLVSEATLEQVQILPKHSKPAVAAATVTADASQDGPLLARSASVREPSKPQKAPAAVGDLSREHGKVDQDAAESYPKPNKDNNKPKFLQLSQAPRPQTQRGEASALEQSNSPRLATMADGQQDRSERQRNNDNAQTNGASSDREDPAATAARARRRAQRRQPEAIPHRPSGSRELRDSRGTGSASAVQRQAMAAAAGTQSPAEHISREASEVLNRVIISKPGVDTEREQERMGEVPTSPEAVPKVVHQLDPASTQSPPEKARGYSDPPSKFKMHVLNRESPIHKWHEERELAPPTQRKTETSQVLNDSSHPEIASQQQRTPEPARAVPNPPPSIEAWLNGTIDPFVERPATAGSVALVEKTNEGSTEGTDPGPGSPAMRLQPQTVGRDPLALLEEMMLTDSVLGRGEEEQPKPTSLKERIALLQKQRIEQAEEEQPKPTSLKERIDLLQKQRMEQASRQAEAAQKKEKSKPPATKKPRPSSMIEKDDVRKTPVSNGTGGPTFTGIGLGTRNPTLDDEYTSPRAFVGAAIGADGAAAITGHNREASQDNDEDWLRTSGERKRDTLVTNPYEGTSPVAAISGGLYRDPLGQDIGGAGEMSRSSNTLPLSPNVRITIIEGDGLIKRDVFSYPDPFARLTVNGEQTKVTTAIKKSIHPYWNESFDVRVKPESIITVEIFDQKKFQKNDGGSLGVIKVRVGQIVNLSAPFQEQIVIRDLKQNERLSLNKYTDGQAVKGKLIINIGRVAKIPSNHGPVASKTPNSDPRTTLDYSQDLDGKPLPYLWERREVLGRTYYVDHNTKKTQWETPLAPR